MSRIFNKSVFLFLLALVIVSFCGCGKEEEVEEKQDLELVENAKEKQKTENAKKNNNSLDDIDDELVTIITEEVNEEFELKAKADTSDWLTYRNEEYGFEVKYPRDWRADETYGDDKKNTGNIVEGLILSAPGDFQGGGTLSIGFSENNNNSTAFLVKDGISIIHSMCPNENIDIKISKFNNAEVIYFDVENNYCGNQGDDWGMSYMYVKNNDLLFSIANVKNPHVNFKFTK